MKTVLINSIFLKAGAIVGTLLFPLSLLAAEEVAATESGKMVFSSEPIGADVIIQLVLSMVFVIGVIVLFAWLMRRVGGIHRQAGNTLQVLGGVSVGTRERVVLVKAGNTQLLLGVAPGQVRKLYVLDKNEEQEGSNENSTSQKEGSFPERLKMALGKGTTT